MGVLGFVFAVVGTMTVVAAVNGRLPLVLAAIFGQSMPVSPSYNSLQQQQALANGLLPGGVVPPVPGGNAIDNPTIPPVYSPPGGWDYSA